MRQSLKRSWHSRKRPIADRVECGSVVGETGDRRRITKARNSRVSVVGFQWLLKEERWGNGGAFVGAESRGDRLSLKSLKNVI